jgi:hypothetical protein
MEELLVLGAILASYENFNGKPAALNLVEVLGYTPCQDRRKQNMRFHPATNLSSGL